MADKQEIKKETDKNFQLKFEFTPAGLKRLRRLQSLGGGLVEAAVMRNALMLYEWYLTETQKGNSLWIQEAKRSVLTEIKLIFPPFNPEEQ